MTREGVEILSHRGKRIKSVAPRDTNGYSEGFVLQMYTEKGLGEIELDREEMRALLQVLPADVMREVLTERRALVALDLDNTPQPADDDSMSAQLCLTGNGFVTLPVDQVHDDTREPQDITQARHIVGMTPHDGRNET